MNMIESGVNIGETLTPERMSDEELGNIVASVGNLESKAILLTHLSMLSGDIHTASSMQYHIDTMQIGGDKSLKWIPEQSTLEGYCNNSFIPIGLVAMQLVDKSENVYGYQVTEKGAKEGASLAGLLLYFSRKHGISLKALFSETSSQSKEVEMGEGGNAFLYKTRAPLNRIKLFRSLISSDLPSRTADLSISTGIDVASVAPHLNNMAEHGLVTKSERNKEGSRTTYVLNQTSDQLPLEPRNQKLTRDVYALLMSQPTDNWTFTTIMQALIEKDPARQAQSSLGQGLRKVIKFLKRNDMIDTPQFDHDKGSEIFLSDEQRALIAELVGILDRFQDRDEEILRSGRTLGSMFVLNSDYAVGAMYQAREASSHADEVPVRMIKKSIITTLMENPDCTAEQVRENLKAYYSYNRALPTIRRYLKDLREDGILVSEGTVGGVMHWNLV